MPLFIPRLLLFAVAIVLLVLLLFYAFTRERKYLRYAARLFKYSLLVLVLLAVALFVARIIRLA